MSRFSAAILCIAGLWFLLLASPRSPGEAAVKYSFAAILLFAAYQRFVGPNKKAADYAKQLDGAFTQLTVSPAAAPTLWFPVGLAILLGAGIVGSGVPYLWVVGLVIGGLLWLTLLKDHRGGRPVKPFVIRVSSEGIETKEKLLRKADIHRLRIRNKFAGSVEIVYDANRGVPTGVAMGLAGRRALAEVAYRVEVEAEGKPYVLAAGLDESTANGVLAEVGRALNAQETQDRH
jgi:hypothetical protein